MYDKFDDNGCCPDCKEPGIACVLGSKAYPHGAHIDDACMKLKCHHGNWKYIGEKRHECGECQALGDPQFLTFDNHNAWEPKNWYSYNEKQGYFVVAQSGLEELTKFSVTSKLESQPDAYGGGYFAETSVRSVCYWEPEVTVCAELPSFHLYQCYDSSDTVLHPECEIKVTVNGYPYDIGADMKSFNALDGNILVFFHNHHGIIIDPYDYYYGGNNGTDAMNTNCINIVGSAGLSVSLCTSSNNNGWGPGSIWSIYSHLYVWAMPDLKGQLYGLCDTFTGEERTGYTMHNGTVTNGTGYYEILDFAESWMINLTAINNPSVDKCATNTTLYDEVQNECTSITHEFCVNHPVKCYGFETACEFDLCRVDDRDAYAQGYINHLKIETHLNS